MMPIRRLLPCVIVIFGLGCTRNDANPAGTSGGSMYGKYRLQDTLYDYTDVAKAQNNAADMLNRLQGESNVCFVGLWAYNPPAIYSAVSSANKLNQVKIVGFDENEQTLQGVKEGTIYGTVVQQPFEFGYQSVKLMAALAKDPNSPLPKEVVNGIMHVPYKVIKKDNVDQFRTQLEEYKMVSIEPTKPAGANAIKVGFVSNNAHEFWTIAEAGTRKAAAEFGVTVLFGRPKDGSVQQQKQIIDDFLTQGVKAIAISVNDPENQSDYLNQVAERIPLITQDNDAPKTKRKCYIGTDNYEAGKAVGKLVKDIMPDGGVIGIFVGTPEALNAQQRRQGVLDELAGKKDANGD